VTGPEHYFLDLRHVSCTASPVRDASGAVVGVLDASSYFDSRQRHTQALVQMSASQIENRLMLHQMRSNWVLAIHPRPEFLGTLSAGLLAFDGGGQLRAANERARALLSGLPLDGQTRFEELFREPFEHVLGRLHRKAIGTELRLCDALGSVLHARCVSDAASAVPATRVPTPRTSRTGLPTTDALRPAGLPRGATQPHATVIPQPDSRAAAAMAQRTPAERQHPTEHRNAHLHDHLRDFVIDDAQVREALELVGAAVRLHAPILIRGESGSGKEMLARHAHAVSGRRGEFVAVNCAALPAELFEAELFGYVGGAYTGARREGDVGLIVSADGGTLLLDEIRELSPTAQAALLRFLDDQQVRPVGGHTLRKVDVQLLAATHADLEAEVAARRFRADLFYRLHTVAVTLPPLRERSDLAAVIDQVLLRLDHHASISAAAFARLRQERWPGNFRELRAVLTRALLRCSDRHIDLVDIERVLGPAPTAPSRAMVNDAHAPQISTPGPNQKVAARESRTARRQVTSVDAPSPQSAATPSPSALQLGATTAVMDEYTRNGGSVSQTSRKLGISRTTVYRHLRLAGAD
jgi:transcriptional regulator of acetoin/glycerol metabolism